MSTLPLAVGLVIVLIAFVVQSYRIRLLSTHYHKIMGMASEVCVTLKLETAVLGAGLHVFKDMVTPDGRNEAEDRINAYLDEHHVEIEESIGKPGAIEPGSLHISLFDSDEDAAAAARMYERNGLEVLPTISFKSRKDTNA